MKALSLRQKLFITIALVVLVYAILSVLFVDLYMKNVLRDKRVAQGRALVTTMSTHVADLLLVKDYLGIDSVFEDIMKANTDVAYIFIEKDGSVLLHTFNDGFPQKLLHAGHRRGAVDHVAITTEKGRFYDFSAPVFGGRAGTLRLGISQAMDDRIMKETKRSLLIVALGVLAVALWITAVVSKRLTAPLAQLTQSARAMADGDYTRTIPVTGDDEVGRLSRAFDRMAQAVRVREKELIEINEELETVNVRLHEYITELQSARDELIKSKQDSAVIDTARSFLHHARQPLTYLIMAIDLLSDELRPQKAADTAALHKRIKVIQDAGQRLSELLKKFEQLRAYRPIKYDETTKIIDIDAD